MYSVYIFKDISTKSTHCVHHLFYLMSQFPSAIKWAKFHRPSTIIGRASGCGYIFNVQLYKLLAMCGSWRMNNIAKWANFSINATRGVDFASVHDGDDDEHNSVCFVEISEVYAMRDAFFFGSGSFERVYQDKNWSWLTFGCMMDSPALFTLAEAGSFFIISDVISKFPLVPNMTSSWMSSRPPSFGCNSG